MERYDFYIGLILTNLMVIGGWLFSVVQSKGALRRGHRVVALAEAYDILIRVGIDGGRSARLDASSQIIDYSRDFERAIATIHLYGDKQQVRLANKLVTQLTKDSFYSADDIVASLRDDIRKQMRMKSLTEKVIYLKQTVTDKRASSPQ